MAGNQAADHGRRKFLQLAGCGLGVVALAAGPVRARAQTTTASPLKIGMVGAGRMGGALGALFIKAGHPVMFSSRHPEHLKALATGLGPLAQAGTVEQAVAFGDVVHDEGGGEALHGAVQGGDRDVGRGARMIALIGRPSRRSTSRPRGSFDPLRHGAPSDSSVPGPRRRSKTRSALK